MICFTRGKNNKEEKEFEHLLREAGLHSEWSKFDHSYGFTPLRRQVFASGSVDVKNQSQRMQSVLRIGGGSVPIVLAHVLVVEFAPLGEVGALDNVQSLKYKKKIFLKERR